ncbi:MAG: [acyl-carrier-protein] S-malonyltransferase, partial [Sphingobacteriia bacterium]
QMVADGATQFTEYGPGKVLQGLVVKIAGTGVQVNGVN